MPGQPPLLPGTLASHLSIQIFSDGTLFEYLLAVVILSCFVQAAEFSSDQHNNQKNLCHQLAK